MDINEIKQKINKLIEKENLEYCAIEYDGECEDNKNIWFYDLIVYDTEEKVDNFVSKLNQYAKADISKNMDDGDYTIECIIKGDD